MYRRATSSLLPPLSKIARHCFAKTTYIRDEDPDEIDNADESTESYKGWTLDDDGMLQPMEVVAQRLQEASDASAIRHAQRLRPPPFKRPAPKKVVRQGAMELTSAVSIALKFVRKVRGIVPEVSFRLPCLPARPSQVLRSTTELMSCDCPQVKLPAPKLGDTNTAWAKAPMTKAAAANHAAAERVTTSKEPAKKHVDDVDNHSMIGRALVGIPEEEV